MAAIGSTLDVVSDILKQNPTDEWSGVLPAVETSFSRCGRLANFISKLAHVVKIPKPTPSDVRINQLAHAVEAFTRQECERRNITLTLALTPEDKLIHVDGIQFEQVLVNIIKNAYEAIGSNGEIQLTTSVSPLSITIADNGSGIPDDSKEKIFTPFFTTKPDGQGIGLMFMREVLLNHACRFRLTSKNGWTTFEIFFE